MIVTLDEMKTHLKVQDDEEDAYLSSLILQAQVHAEDFCRVHFEDDTAPEPVRLAVMLFTSYLFEHRDQDDTVSYSTTMKAFRSLIYPYRDPTKMF